jgi:hypothetical protein
MGIWKKVWKPNAFWIIRNKFDLFLDSEFDLKWRRNRRKRGLWQLPDFQIWKGPFLDKQDTFMSKMTLHVCFPLVACLILNEEHCPIISTLQQPSDL